MVPLHEAASSGHKEVILVLLSMNAPVLPRTVTDDVPEDLAIKNGHQECVELLRKYIYIYIFISRKTILKKLIL